MNSNVEILLVPQDDVTKLEALNYEVSARTDIISFMLSNGLRTDTDNFKKYQAEQIDFKIQYEKAKKEFETKFIRPRVEEKKCGLGSWSLDFKKCEVTVVYTGKRDDTADNATVVDLRNKS